MGAKLDGATKRWFELNDVQAHQKIGHAIRDTIRLNRKHAAAAASSKNSKIATKSGSGSSSGMNKNKKPSPLVAAQQLRRQARTVRRESLDRIRFRSSFSSIKAQDELKSMYQFPTSIDAAVDGLEAIIAEFDDDNDDSKSYGGTAAEGNDVIPKTIVTTTATTNAPTKSSHRRFLLENEFPEQDFDYSPSQFFGDFNLSFPATAMEVTSQ